MQNPDNQARVHDLPEHLPVRVRTQTRHAQAGLEKQIDLMVYKLYDLTPEEIAIEDKLKWLEQINEFTSMVLSGREKELREKLRVCEIYRDGNK